MTSLALLFRQGKPTNWLALGLALLGTVGAWWVVADSTRLDGANHVSSFMGVLWPPFVGLGALFLAAKAVLFFRSRQHSWAGLMGLGALSWCYLGYLLPIDAASVTRHQFSLHIITTSFLGAAFCASGLYIFLARKEGPKLPNWLAPAFALMTSIVFTVVALHVSLGNYKAYIPGANDLGMYQQIHWSMFRHKMFYTTLFEFPFSAQLSRFDYNYHAEHFMPLLFLTSLIHYPIPSPVTLLVLHVLAMGSSLIVLYFLALRILGSRWFSAVLVFCLAANPVFQNGVLTDFYPDAFIPIFVFSALLCLENKSRIGYGLFLILAMMCKEDVSIWLLFFSPFLGWVKKDWRLGVLTALMSIGYFLFVATPVMRLAVTGTDESYIRHVDRYGHLLPHWISSDAPVHQRLLAIVLEPDRLWSHLIAAPHLAAAFKVLVPLGLVALVYPPAWIAFVPVMAAHLLSNWAPQSRFEMYHALGVFPWVILASLYSLQRIGGGWESQRPLRVATCAAMLLLSFLLFLRLGTLPGGGRLDAAYQNRHQTLQWREQFEALIDAVPADAPVAATSNLTPRLASRPAIFMLPDLPPETQYIAVSLRGFIGPMPPTTLRMLVMRQYSSGEWELLHGELRSDFLLMGRVLDPEL